MSFKKTFKKAEIHFQLDFSHSFNEVSSGARKDEWLCIKLKGTLKEWTFRGQIRAPELFMAKFYVRPEKCNILMVSLANKDVQTHFLLASAYCATRMIHFAIKMNIMIAYYIH